MTDPGPILRRRGRRRVHRVDGRRSPAAGRAIARREDRDRRAHRPVHGRCRLRHRLREPHAQRSRRPHERLRRRRRRLPGVRPLEGSRDHRRAHSCRAASTAPTSRTCSTTPRREAARACAGSPARRRRSRSGRTARFASASSGAAPIVADRVVLAIGNFPPADPTITDPAFYSDPRYARDPWAATRSMRIRSQPVLLIGTGLTMLDIALALRDRGQRAPDPRGLAAWAAATASPRVLGRPAALSAARRPRRLAPHGSGLLRSLRAEVDGATRGRNRLARGPHVAQSGHARRCGDRSTRPRRSASCAMPGPTGRPIVTGRLRKRQRRSSELLSTGRLRVVAGHLLGFEPPTTLIDARLRLRGRRESSTVRVGKVVNCTGPDTDLRRVDEPLVQQLLANGLATPDPLGLGLQSSEGGELIDGEGRAGERLFLVGPLRKGLLWENTAVPELRVEAERMASAPEQPRDRDGRRTVGACRGSCPPPSPSCSASGSSGRSPASSSRGSQTRSSGSRSRTGSSFGSTDCDRRRAPQRPGPWQQRPASSRRRGRRASGRGHDVSSSPAATVSPSTR